MAAIRAFFLSQSKRVSQLEDAFANRFRAVDEFFFHGGLVTFFVERTCICAWFS
jgi:hypothetical protein